MEINKATFGIAAGLAGTLFLGYCIYFDKKRRSDPEYKKKVHERRRKQKKAASESSTRSKMPNLNDHQEVERYFLQEIQSGESLIAVGDIERGVEHLANAIAVCGQPTRLLQILQNSLPSQVFVLLVQKMQEYGNRSASDDDKPNIIIGSGKTGGEIGDNGLSDLE